MLKLSKNSTIFTRCFVQHKEVRIITGRKAIDGFSSLQLPHLPRESDGDIGENAAGATAFSLSKSLFVTDEHFLRGIQLEGFHKQYNSKASTWHCMAVIYEIRH